MRFSLEAKLAVLVLTCTIAAVIVTLSIAHWFDEWRPAAAVSLLVSIALALAFTHRAMGPVNRLFQALKDGVESLRESDFSISIAVRRNDELGDLVKLYNQVGDVLRRERQNLFQRELLLDTVIQSTQLALVLTDDADHVIYSNSSARQLLNGGRRLEGHTLADLLQQVPTAMREAALARRDTLFTLEAGDEPETWHVSHGHFVLNTRRHHLFLFKQLTRELNRQEVAVWKKVIRVISHELNNSLAPISSLAHSGRQLVDAPDRAKLERIFAVIDERAQALKAFIDGYARFAKLPQPRPESVALPPFLAALQQTVPFRIDGELPDEPAWFDPVQMQQVLINLLKNAHEAGGPVEQVAVRARRDPHGIQLQVLDRGGGMSPAVLDSALLPFFSTKHSGTGLGLALAREITEAHGGRLHIVNRDGGGLVVTLWLPPEAR